LRERAAAPATETAGVRERAPNSFGFPYSERHLQAVWYDPHWRPAALSADDGEPVTVDDPGRWNLEAGPDFLDAVLRLGTERRRVRGDVEVHIHPADWAQHRHEADARYARVVAHVCYFPAGRSAAARPPGAVLVSLRDALAANPYFSFESIDPSAYPYSALPDRPTPCARALAARPASERAAILDAAGQERLRAKAARLQAALQKLGPEAVLYEESLGALGYKHNRIPFRELARRAPLERLREDAEGRPLDAYAILLGVAGLLPAQSAPHWDAETRRFVRGLWDIWWKRRERWAARLMPERAWRLSNLRPQNHPVRRLVAAATLFAAPPDPCARLLGIGTADAATWRLAAAACLQPARDADDPLVRYWTRRLSFGRPPRPTPTAFIGPGRMAALLNNVAIPFLAALDRPVTTLLDAPPPEDDNALLRDVAYALLGRDHNPEIYANGLRQQGLIQIFHDFCVANRSACRDCAFAAALGREVPGEEGLRAET
jgi:hypothetical protein